ncbi:MAG: hypothetical protein ABIH00_03575 [Armatimonadota bacterium]
MSRKILFTVISLFILVFCMQLSLYADKDIIDAGLQITSPAQGASFEPGQDCVINVTMNKDAAQTAKSLLIRFTQNNRITDKLIEEGIQPLTQVTIHIPSNISAGPVEIYVQLNSDSELKNNIAKQTVNIIKEKPDVDIEITEPVKDAKFCAGEDIKINTKINSEAISGVKYIEVNLCKDDEVVVRAEIDKPQEKNNTVLQIPKNAKPGDLFTVKAVAMPCRHLSDHTAKVAIGIKEIDAELRLIMPGMGASIKQSEEFEIQFSINEDALKLAEKVLIKLKTPVDTILYTKTIDDPQAINSIRAKLKKRDYMGDADLYITLSPHKGLKNYEVKQVIRVIE